MVDNQTELRSRPLHKVLAGHPEMKRLLLEWLAARNHLLLQQLRVAANWETAQKTQGSLDEVDTLANLIATAKVTEGEAE